MPKTYKVREQMPNGDILLYHSSADIVELDESAVQGLGNNIETAVTRLKEKAESKADTTTLNTTIKASAFSNGVAPYTQTITVSGIKETDNPIAGVVFSDSSTLALKQKEAWGTIDRITTGNDKITVYCYEDKPSVDIPIQLKVVR